MLIRKPYDERPRVTLAFHDVVDDKIVPHVGRTKQAMKKDCDINTIMAKYAQRGVVDHLSRYKGEYGDFINAPTFHEATQALAEAQEAFDTLPAAVRKRFENDPAAFLEFAQDEANLDQMREMGLAPPARPPEAPRDPPSPEPTPPEPAPEPSSAA